MAGKYHSYSSYKESGVAWLGDVPRHWEPLRFKHALYEKKKTLNPDLRAGSISFGRVIYKNTETLSSETKDSYQEVLSGEFLINPLNMNYDLLSLRTGLSSINVVVSTGYIVLKSIGRLSKRYTRWLLHEFDVAHMKTLGSGVRQTINFADIGNSQFHEPTKEEQEKIADFLDHETTKIDTLIEKQQQLIKLLKEKRQAVISHAVTKGLNPNTPLRKSGVEWLGEVPKNWSVCRVKQISNFITSGPRGWSDYLTENGDRIFLQSGDLNKKLGLKLAEAKKVSPPNNAEGIRTKLENGDVVVCITGANTGRVAITPKLRDTVYINQHLSLIRPVKALIDSEYLGFVLSSSSVKSYFSVTQYGLKEGLSLSNVAEAPLSYPPLEEQREIVSYIKIASNKYDVFELSVEKQVELLHERRTALISAAVTGKIDVRNWVSPEPSNTANNKEVAA